VESPWIGIATQTLTPELASHFSLREKRGVIIRAVEPESPAARADLQRGDVMVALDGRPVVSSEDYLQRERTYTNGAQLRFRVVRDQQERDITVTAARFPQEKVDALVWQLLGLEVTEKGDTLTVTKIRPKSSSARVGFRAGDTIVGVAGNQVSTLAEFRRKVIEARLGQTLLLSVGRGRQLYHVTVPLDQG
jgi:S1-C subfamily serine protease